MSSPPEPEPVVVLVSPEDEGERADVVLGRHVPGLSRRVARRMALEGRLRGDGERLAPSHRVRAGERLELHVPTDPVGPPELTVLAVTEQFVYVDKPAGVHTHALRPGERDCLSAAVAERHPECAEASAEVDPREGGAVHRLDRNTSGVVAFARNPEAYRRAREAFTEGEVFKDYLARVSAQGPWPPPTPEGALPGWLGPGEALAALPGFAVVGEAMRVRAPLGRGEQRAAVAVRLDGQRSTTVVQPVRPSDGTAPEARLLHLQLETGRRHQARVHLAWLGLPILGDALYGPKDPAARASSGRLHLHAARLDLGAAIPGESPVFAPLPAGFLAPG